jgi:aspartate/methionine/tyrosine aminotransferase
LGDEKWLENYIQTYRERLSANFEMLTEALAVIDVTVYESEGTLMTWADFRSFLPKNPSEDDEKHLCEQLFEHCGLLLTPGMTCMSTEPGFFRIVYTESGEGSLQELK